MTRRGSRRRSRGSSPAEVVISTDDRAPLPRSPAAPPRHVPRALGVRRRARPRGAGPPLRPRLARRARRRARRTRPRSARPARCSATSRELQPGGLPHLARPVVRRSDAFLWLDEMTRRNLELVEPLRAGARGCTLLETIDATVTPMGGRLLRQWLLSPLRDPAAIDARLDAVEVAVRDSRGRARLREALDGVRDLERLAGRAAAGRADAPRAGRAARLVPAAPRRGRGAERARRVRPAGRAARGAWPSGRGARPAGRPRAPS